MAKVYFVRHQAAGYLTAFPFADPPTDAQIASIKKLCDMQHGTHHAKTEEPYWLKGVGIDLLDSEADPFAMVETAAKEAQAARDKATAGLPKVEFSATGHVENPK